jgi:hypothetical protein
MEPHEPKTIFEAPPIETRADAGNLSSALPLALLALLGLMLLHACVRS